MVTDQKPNCSTCFIKEYGDGTISIRNHGMDGDNEIWLEQSEIQFIREYLMREAVKKIQCQSEIADRCGMIEHSRGLKEAISLIRDGVKK